VPAAEQAGKGRHLSLAAPAEDSVEDDFGGSPHATIDVRDIFLGVDAHLFRVIGHGCRLQSPLRAVLPEFRVTARASGAHHWI